MQRDCEERAAQLIVLIYARRAKRLSSKRQQRHRRRGREERDIQLYGQLATVQSHFGRFDIVRSFDQRLPSFPPPALCRTRARHRALLLATSIRAGPGRARPRMKLPPFPFANPPPSPSRKPLRDAEAIPPSWSIDAGAKRCIRVSTRTHLRFHDIMRLFAFRPSLPSALPPRASTIYAVALFTDCTMRNELSL